MGEKFPQANYRNVVKAAKGSHEIWRRADGRYATIPRHGSSTIKRKTFKGILEDFQIAPKEFIRLKKGKR